LTLLYLEFCLFWIACDSPSSPLASLRLHFNLHFPLSTLPH
jgi:hypothetical protein